MPRGAKKDTTVTKALVANGIFWDKRSFISLGTEPHLYLKGDDIKLMRQRVWARAKRKCANCKREIIYQDFDADWEMDHKQGGTVGRCDCLHNLQVLCRPCHRAKHVQVKFTQRKEEAKKQFDELYPVTA